MERNSIFLPIYIPAKKISIITDCRISLSFAAAHAKLNSAIIFIAVPVIGFFITAITETGFAAFPEIRSVAISETWSVVIRPVIQMLFAVIFAAMILAGRTEADMAAGG